MWARDWREAAWERLAEPWDLIVVGGGITGAGVLREAVRLGLRTLLVEKRDFAWGTSSRSSKLVHGGLRYLKQGRLRLTRASVQERQRLLEEGPGLIDPLGFLLATYKGDHPGRWTYSAGLSVYDLLALQWTHRHYSSQDFQMLAPHLTQIGLEGGFHYGDAQTDDARLVLRVIREAVASGPGALALNYLAVEGLICDEDTVTGVRLRDQVTGSSAEAIARVVVNATGAWSDALRTEVGAPARMRPLRGSHLIFPAWRLPVAQAVGFLHPVDARPVFIFPWEGITLVGTTDVDHDQDVEGEPSISAAEVAYLMAAVEYRFPCLELTLDDVLSTFAGVRPVVATGKVDPSKESRDHVVWEERGLLTVAGGKLTTFRLLALDVLKAVGHRLPDLPPVDEQASVLDAVDVDFCGAEQLHDAARRRLLGRYGAEAPALVAAAEAGELDAVPGTQVLWAELRWAARAEGVVHLDDLLLRRVRLGHLLPEGGKESMDRVRAICQAELGWDDERWRAEEASYLALWQSSYSLPQRSSIPDWKAMLAEASAQRAAQPSRRRKVIKRSTLAAGLLVLAAIVAWLYGRCRRR